MRPVPVQIRGWLMQPEVWRFVGFASTVVGLLCYALSSSFNHLFGHWDLLKIFLYSVFSFIICLAILFAKVWQYSTSLRWKAHMAVLVLTVTSVYSFFFDKSVNGKPDAYSLISCAAFSMMSLSVSRQTHCGFEVDLLYFFLGCLIVQLMKIKLLFAIVGAGFSYSLIVLRSSLDDNPPENGFLGLQDQHHVAIQVDSQQEVNTGSVVFTPEFMACIEALRQKNSNIVDMLLEQVKEYLEAVDDSELVTDHNFVMDALLPSGIIKDLHETVKFMVAVGLEKECSHLYGSCRREFLEECIRRFGLQEFNIEDPDNMRRMELEEDMIRRWIKASNVVVRILFPSERRLCNSVFFGLSSSAADLCFIEVCREAKIQLLNFSDAVARGRSFSWRRLFFEILSMYETLRDLIPEFQSLFSDGHSESLVNKAITTQKRLGKAITAFFTKSNDLIFRFKEAKLVVPGGGLHPITIYAMNYLRSACRSRQTLEQILQEYSKVADRAATSSSFSVQMVWIMEELERKLEAKSKIYKKHALGFVFMMNNRKHIEQEAKESELGTLLGDNWIQKNTAKIGQNRERYQRSSWNKVLDYLKLDGYESMAPNVAVESMKEKLNFFNMQFEEKCSAHSTWCVFDEHLREEIIISLENILLPAYGNFIGRFQNVLGKHAYEHIKYGIFDIEARLHDLFQGGRG